MNKNLLVLFVYSLIFFGLNLPASAQTNTLKRYKSVKTPVTGFGEAFCAELPDKLNVCKALVDRNAGNDAKFLVRRGDKTLGEWKTEVTMYSDVKDFEVLEGDLDGNGSPEIIVPQLDGESNGMGIRYFSIYILPNPLAGGFQAPLIINTQEFGANGTFISNSQAKTFDILVTYWTNGFNLPNITPKAKEETTYFIGRWFRYRSGKLAPAFERPVLARRYLDSFQAERDKEDSSENFPYSWLQNKTTLQLKSDPEVSSKTLSTLHGTIEKYERRELPTATDAERTFAYELYMIKLDSGKRISYVFAPQSEIDENFKNLKKPFINRIGFLPARLTLPKEVGVMDIFNAAGKNTVENKKVTITTHPAVAGGSDAQRVLWFEGK